MTTLRVIPGGSTPRQPPPLRWTHVEDGSGREVIRAVWTTDGGQGLAMFALEAGRPPLFLAGNRPDEVTLQELAEDVVRYQERACEGMDLIVEGARGGARYYE